MVNEIEIVHWHNLIVIPIAELFTVHSGQMVGGYLQHLRHTLCGQLNR